LPSRAEVVHRHEVETILRRWNGESCRRKESKRRRLLGLLGAATLQLALVDVLSATCSTLLQSHANRTPSP
jgi:hypothetical protein